MTDSKPTPSAKDELNEEDLKHENAAKERPAPKEGRPDSEMANAAKYFLGRATLQGTEALSFMQVINWIEEKGAENG